MTHSCRGRWAGAQARSAESFRNDAFWRRRALDKWPKNSIQSWGDECVALLPHLEWYKGGAVSIPEGPVGVVFPDDPGTLGWGAPIRRRCVEGAWGGREAGEGVSWKESPGPWAVGPDP